MSHIVTVAVGLLEWTVAIVSVVGTLALVGWLLKMIVQKDKPDERSECKPDRAQPLDR